MQGLRSFMKVQVTSPLLDRTPDSVFRHKIFATTASHKVKCPQAQETTALFCTTYPLTLPLERQLPRGMSW